MFVKGEMSLFILTKFAMVFFIMALALIIFFVGKIQAEQSCNEQIQLSAKTIASRISQVVFASSEDERRVYKVPSSIQLGEGRARYAVNITLLGDNSSNQFLSVVLKPQGSYFNCGGGTAVSVPDLNVVFVDPNGGKVLKDVEAEPEQNFLELHPSELKDFGIKTRYLVVLKCSTKSYPPQKYLYLHDCAGETLESSDNCLQLSGGGAAGNVDSCCGWPGGNCP